LLNQEHIGCLTLSDDFGLRKRAAGNFAPFCYLQSTRPDDIDGVSVQATKTARVTFDPVASPDETIDVARHKMPFAGPNWTKTANQSWVRSAMPRLAS